MRILASIAIILFSQTLFAQIAPPKVGAGNPLGATAVNASDGVYEKFVLVRWEEAAKSSGYRLFRSNSPSGASLQEITKAAQKSTWFCDYSAEKDHDYFYAVMIEQEGSSGPLSQFDKGFLKKEVKMANEESLSALTSDKVASGRLVFVLVSDVSTDTAQFQVSDTVKLHIGLQNIFEEPTAETYLRIYLSDDAVWNFDDKLLTTKTFSSFPADAATTLTESVVLPADLLPGNYHLLVITAAEGNILNAKTGTTSIQITNQ